MTTATTVRICDPCAMLVLAVLRVGGWCCFQCGSSDLTLPAWALPYPGDGLTDDPAANAHVRGFYRWSKPPAY